MNVVELSKVKTFSEFLKALDIETIDNVSYDEFTCDNAIKMSKNDLIQNFQFDKETAQKIYDAFSCVRKFKKMQKPSKHVKPPYLPALLASAFGYQVNLPSAKFSEAFNSMDDIKYMPGDEWSMDFCTAAESAIPPAFNAILLHYKKSTREWNQYTNKDGWTPLMYATALGRIKIVDILLKNDVSIKARSKCGLTALMLAASFGHENVIQLFIEYAKKHANLYQNNMKQTIVKDLLTLNYTDNRGYTALHYAAYYNQIEALKLLLKDGADPNCPDNSGMTPTLVSCIEESQETSLKTLVEYGGNLELTNNEGLNGYELAGERSTLLDLKYKTNGKRVLQMSCPDTPKYVYGSF